MLLKELGEEETYYYHPDHLGSVSVVSNHKGEPYERVEYLPFGELWIEETDPATGYIPFRFTSKEYDEETGLYYYGARYYEPRLSRWMSADPAGFALINPMGEDGKPRAGYSVIEAANWYAYVSNNPVKYVDPTGIWDIAILIEGELAASGGGDLSGGIVFDLDDPDESGFIGSGGVAIGLTYGIAVGFAVFIREAEGRGASIDGNIGKLSFSIYFDFDDEGNIRFNGLGIFFRAGSRRSRIHYRK